MSDTNETEIQQQMAEHQAAIKQLQKQQAELAEKGKSDAIANINAKIEKFGITMKDLRWPKESVTGKNKAKSKPWPPKYRDAKTGTTWNGRGKAPHWISGKDRIPFLINQEANDSASASPLSGKAKKAP